MKDLRITAKRVKEVFETNKFVILTHWSGWEIGINCKTINTKMGRLNFTKSKLRMKTRYISFRPCSLNEYISKKGYFIKS